jgi:hypothetical protein
VLFPALSAPTAQTLSSERWLMMVIMGSITAMKILASPPDADGAGRSLGECSKEVSVWLSFAIGEHVY